MLYFKKRSNQAIKRPSTYRVLGVQGIIILVVALTMSLFDVQNGLTALLGGVIAIGGQAFYNLRALQFYGTPNIGLILSSSSSAMWGKWLIIISATTASAVLIEDINVTVLYASVFGLHTLGAMLLPVLVKRAS